MKDGKYMTISDNGFGKTGYVFVIRNGVFMFKGAMRRAGMCTEKYYQKLNQFKDYNELCARNQSLRLKGENDDKILLLQRRKNKRSNNKIKIK